MEKIAYGGWRGCFRLSNGKADLVVTGDVGPRIIRFGFVGGANELKEYPDMLGRTGDDEWLIYGGHRLWHSPEAKPRSYCPDNGPVEVTERGGAMCVVQPVEATTGIRKEIGIRLSPERASVEITHRLVNTNLWAVELAPWALTVMAPGGEAIIPAPPRGSHEEHLLPTHTLTLWAYTDMTDPRWTWGRRYVMLRQDPSATGPQKVGVRVADGWAAYARDGRLFVKTFGFDPCACYPDWGCSVESFTNADMLELETVAPMAALDPGAAVEHVERWHLFDGCPVPGNDEDVDRDVLPRVREAQASATK